MKTEKSNLEKNTKEINYKEYVLNKKEKISCVAVWTLFSIIAALLFYKNVFASVLFLALLPWVLKKYSEMLLEKRKEKLKSQFISGMSAYAAALRSGYSAENAIKEARREIERMEKEGAMLAAEFKKIERKLSCHESIESAFKNLSKRTGIEEIEDMAQIFAVSKRSGGSLSEIVTNTVNILKDKNRVREEISTMMTAKKLEYRIMCLMPAGILLYVNLTSPEFISMLYEGILGRVAMTAVLVVYALAIFLGEKIMKIEM